MSIKIPQRILLLCILAGVLQSGCFWMNLRLAGQPIVKETTLTSEPVKGNKDPDQLETLLGPARLPQGIYYLTRPRQRRRITTADGRQFYRSPEKPPAAVYALPKYPKAGQAHRVLARYRWSFPRRYRGSRTEIPDEVRKRASKLGANTLFRLSRRQPECYALYVSDAIPAQTFAAANQLLKKEATRHAGFAATDPVQTHKFTDIKPLTFTAAASRCYRLVLALPPKSYWSKAALNGVLAVVSSHEPSLRRRVVATEVYPTPTGFAIRAPFHGKYAHSRALSIPLGCATQKAIVSVRLTSWRRGGSLGEGQYHARILHKAMSDDDLASDRRKLSELIGFQRQYAHRMTRLARLARSSRVRRRSRRARRIARRARRIARREQRVRRNTGGNFLEDDNDTSHKTDHSPRETDDPPREVDDAREIARERRRRLRRQRARRRTRRRTRSRHFRVTLRNRCRRTVRLFIGRKPRFSSGVNTSIGSNTTTSRSGFAPKTFWIVDRSGRGISSYTVGPGSHTLLITRSCAGFTLR